MNGNYQQVRAFYQHQLLLSDYEIGGLSKGFADSRIARIELGRLGNSGLFDSVEMELIVVDVPSPVRKAFDRHAWLSKYCLSNVCLFRVPVAGQVTYALTALGYVSDGWDGFCQLLEIFDHTGVFVGATKAEADNFTWLTVPFNGDAFPGSPDVHWTPTATVDENALWSVEKAMRIEDQGKMARLKFPWADIA
ncbi:hypothetical protein IQ266_06525 [filamentous cyanobacterium LEGE 11480]|uniref:Uncharacterized protein n=1 Tax=Romeriopsis navalis LEGE 11480 TaxID=2777977 RepID=A0A928Z2U7_9CYAN|nr:hypothetical protein [Romeriopsis navalis]MBE9029417.1 hypothetical protein [Romeriopsis navalis LEGE 11480]